MQSVLCGLLYSCFITVSSEKSRAVCNQAKSEEADVLPAICRVVFFRLLFQNLGPTSLFLAVGKLPDCSLERFERREKHAFVEHNGKSDLLLLLRGRTSLPEIDDLLESLDPQCLTLSSAPGRFEIFSLSRHGGGGG